MVATTNVPVSERTVVARSAPTTLAASISPTYLDNLHGGGNHSGFSGGNWKNLENGHSLYSRRSSSVGNLYTSNTGGGSDDDDDGNLGNRACDRGDGRLEKLVGHVDGSCSAPMAPTQSQTPPIRSALPPGVAERNDQLR